MDSPIVKVDMSGWSDAKKLKYTEAKKAGTPWLSDDKYAAKNGFTAKPGGYAASR